MKYRKINGSNKLISEIALGAGNLYQLNDSDVEELVNYGLANGINFIDIISVNDSPFNAIAKSLKGKREDIFLQGHFGIEYSDNQVAISRDLNQIKEEFERILNIFETDFLDFGLVHYVDDLEDFNYIMSSGIWDYLKDLKEKGQITKLGFCSHTIDISKKFIDTGDIDIFMLGINPLYDFTEENGNLVLSKERIDFYKECEKKNIDIVVMKPFAGGSLLNDGISRLNKKMTVHQCLQYVLDRPAVATSLVGVSSLDELKEVLNFYNRSKKEKDYSFIGSLESKNFTDNDCIYCNHCLPCPSNIDIGLVNKYYDLASIGDKLASDHYFNLKFKASDCTQCGSCNDNCHFNVNSSERMKNILEFFSE